MKTYSQIADELGTDVEALHIIVSREISPLVPAGKQGRLVIFEDEIVEQFKQWWAENEIYHSSNTPKGEAFDEAAARAYLSGEAEPMPLTTLQYYRRRYGKLWPDFYQKGATKGRPRAMYLRSSLDEFKSWVEAGKPELRIVSLTLGGQFDVMARFEDGVTVGLTGARVDVSPASLSGVEREEYIRTTRIMSRRKLRNMRRRKKKSE